MDNVIGVCFKQHELHSYKIRREFSTRESGVSDLTHELGIASVVPAWTPLGATGLNNNAQDIW